MIFNIRHTKMKYCNAKVCAHYNMGECRCKTIGLDHTGFCMNFTPFLTPAITEENSSNEEEITRIGNQTELKERNKIGF